MHTAVVVHFQCASPAHRTMMRACITSARAFNHTASIKLKCLELHTRRFRSDAFLAH